MPSVLIVGCGVFGLSTAVELAQKGYAVTAVDAYEPPSPWSAACDYNKIIRAEYTDLMYTRMAIEAIHMWRSNPLFKGIYNECGRVMVTPAHHNGRQEFERIGFANLAKIGEGTKVQTFKGGEELARQIGFLKYNTITREELTRFNPESGLAHAANSMVALYKEAQRLGVQFVFGDGGKAVKVEKKGTVASIVTAAGTSLTADQILIASGANSGRVVDLENQQTATGLFVTFIKLTPDEYEQYKDMAILFDAELGYFFPPDPETHLLKIALPGTGATNLVADPHNAAADKLSLPRYHPQHPADTMPTWGIRKTKMVLGKYIPDLAYHKLFNSKVCWVADTADSHFIIDADPAYSNLYVATGDSGHGFKFLPNIGKYIVQMLEGRLSPEMKTAWKWRGGAGTFNATDCDWRVVDEFPDLSEVDWVVEQAKPKL